MKKNLVKILCFKSLSIIGKVSDYEFIFLIIDVDIFISF